jgi:hypothetical protein
MHGKINFIAGPQVHGLSKMVINIAIGRVLDGDNRNAGDNAGITRLTATLGMKERLDKTDRASAIQKFGHRRLAAQRIAGEVFFNRGHG